MKTLIIKALIEVPYEGLPGSTDDLLAGIQARLHPVVACHPDETISRKATVTLEAVREDPEPERWTVEQAIELCKAEILEMLREGVHTSRGMEHPTADDFSDFGSLHHYCDANTLGRMCDEDLILVLDGHEIPLVHVTDEDQDRWLRFVHPVQDAVDAWLKADGHRV